MENGGNWKIERCSVFCFENFQAINEAAIDS